MGRLEKYISTTENIIQDSKKIREDIIQSKGQYDLSHIDNWVLKNLGGFKKEYGEFIKSLDSDDLYYYQVMVLEVFNKTYIKKLRLLKMKKNGSDLDGAFNTLLHSYEKLLYWDKELSHFNWFELYNEFSFPELFEEMGKYEEGKAFYESLFERVKSLEGEDYFMFLRKHKYNMEYFIKSPLDKLVHRIKLQYELWTIPYLKNGYKLESPTKITVGEEVLDGGEYYEIKGIIEKYCKNLDEEEFSILYSELLVENDIEAIVNKFKIKYGKYFSQ